MSAKYYIQVYTTIIIEGFENVIGGYYTLISNNDVEDKREAEHKTHLFRENITKKCHLDLPDEIWEQIVKHSITKDSLWKIVQDMKTKLNQRYRGKRGLNKSYNVFIAELVNNGYTFNILYHDHPDYFNQIYPKSPPSLNLDKSLETVSDKIATILLLDAMHEDPNFDIRPLKLEDSYQFDYPDNW